MSVAIGVVLQVLSKDKGWNFSGILGRGYELKCFESTILVLVLWQP